MSYMSGHHGGYDQEDSAAWRHGTRWTAAEDQTLRQLTKEGATCEAIAEVLSRRENSIRARQSQMGIGEFDYGHLRVSQKEVSDEKVRLSHLLTLLQDNYTTVGCCFHNSGKVYTYKVHRDDLPEVGELMVVPTDSGEFKVVTVARVDPEPNIDISAPYALKWAVQRVSVSKWAEQRDVESAAIEKIKANQRAAAREAALKALLGDSSLDEIRAMLTLKK